MERQVSIERAGRIAWDAARRMLEADPAGIVCDDPRAQTLRLQAEVGGFDVGRDVTVRVGEPRQLDAHAVAVPVEWEAAEHPARFPTFDGLLELSVLTERPPSTRVALLGTVRAPLGPLGRVGEALGGAVVGDAVLAEATGRVIERLVDAVALAATAEEIVGGRYGGPRIVLPD